MGHRLSQLALFGREHPPTWRDVIADLRWVNQHWTRPGWVSLNVHGQVVPSNSLDRGEFPLYGREAIPASRRFDAPAAARRLLAALRAGEAIAS